MLQEAEVVEGLGGGRVAEGAGEHAVDLAGQHRCAKLLAQDLTEAVLRQAAIDILVV